MTEREALRMRVDIERHYPQLVIDACGELFHGKGWELVVHEERFGRERLLELLGDHFRPA